MVVLVLPEVNLLDLGGPVQVFDAAAHLGGGYRLEYVAETDGVRSAQGLELAGLGRLAATRAGAGDLVLVPGPRLTASDRLVPEAAVRWVRDAHDAGARVAAVCSGAAVLGEAGLLDGRACTTHWQLTAAMRERYPAARVREAALYVHDGRVSTSAGISAGIDLALSLVERDRGPELVAAVARELVLYLRRDGDAAQISPFLRYRDHVRPAVHRVQDHLAQHLDAAHTLTDLAAVAHLSPRGLTRAFTTATGITPLAYQRQLRLERARTLLAATDLTVEAVAAQCGFRDARQLRRLVTEAFGASPSELRARLRPAG
ncbi:AraC family transcriptional regulator [Streptomyces shenzhenensis]|uniref:AraC family transcriptional regulator n=1 Tax=Streptomyces shenzhenensis TaxID=943815 RepID=A0A3M0I0Z6_9ACTN|nr:AraC family transcriptional regulator [Streptomyces shenzhenensis]